MSKVARQRLLIAPHPTQPVHKETPSRRGHLLRVTMVRSGLRPPGGPAARPRSPISTSSLPVRCRVAVDSIQVQHPPVQRRHLDLATVAQRAGRMPPAAASGRGAALPAPTGQAARRAEWPMASRASFMVRCLGRAGPGRVSERPSAPFRPPSGGRQCRSRGSALGRW